MPVGKGSIKRATETVAENTEKPVNTIENNIVEIGIADLKFKKCEAGKELTESIKKYGMILPVVAVKDGEILKVADGAKRLSACKELGVSAVKVIIVSGSTVKEITAALQKSVKPVENIHEEKFNVIKQMSEEKLPFYLL